METSKVICFEIKKEERVYRLELSEGAPLGEAYEAVVGFLGKISALIHDHTESVKPKEAEPESEAESDQDS